MSWVFGALAATLGLLLVWGVIAPRGQWRALSAWSVGDAYRNEPGGTAYGLRRLISGAGALALLGVFVVTPASTISLEPRNTPQPNPIAVMWGAPDPQIIDRIVTPLPGAPGGLVDVPLLDYQAFDADGPPKYLDALRDFTLLGSTNIAGYVGSLPDIGNGALDFANIIVHVRGPILCVPRGVVVIEGDTTVQIGVFYGLPDAADGTTPDNAKGCPLDGSVKGSVLIPLQLHDPLGERTVQTLAGDDVPSVPLP